MWVLPYILWGCVALFVWWFIGILAIASEYHNQQLQNKWLRYRRDVGLRIANDVQEKKLIMLLGPFVLSFNIFSNSSYLFRLWRRKRRESYQQTSRLVLFFAFFNPVRIGAIIGSKLGELITSTT